MPRRPYTAAAAAALVAGAVLVARFSGTAAGGADSSGYLTSARMFAAGRLHERVRTPPGVRADAYPPGLFVPLGLRPGREPLTAVPTYPPGLPLHLAAASLLVGLGRAPVAVNVLAWVAAVVFVYRLARVLALPRDWCVASVLAFALFPLTVLQSTRVMSDLLATAWCTAAASFALRGRKRTAYAVAAGASFGVAILVRPTDALLAPAIALALGGSPPALAAALAGAAPLLAGLGLYNLAEYGRVFTTGYTGIAALVSPANFPAGAAPLRPLAGDVPRGARSRPGRLRALPGRAGRPPPGRAARLGRRDRRFLHACTSSRSTGGGGCGSSCPPCPRSSSAPRSPPGSSTPPRPSGGGPGPRSAALPQRLWPPACSGLSAFPRTGMSPAGCGRSERARTSTPAASPGPSAELPPNAALLAMQTSGAVTSTAASRSCATTSWTSRPTRRFVTDARTAGRAPVRPAFPERQAGVRTAVARLVAAPRRPRGSLPLAAA